MGLRLGPIAAVAAAVAACFAAPASAATVNAQAKAIPSDLAVIAKPIDLAALRAILRPLLEKDVAPRAEEETRRQSMPEGVK